MKVGFYYYFGVVYSMGGRLLLLYYKFNLCLQISGFAEVIRPVIIADWRVC